MERSNRSAAPRLRAARICARRCTNRQGKVTLVTLIAILGLVVLAGFVGNAGHVVTTKVGTQNGADAITFSSAQWMARGMNAVTATNHLLGEVTGLVVVVEALGGPEAEQKMEDYPVQPRTVDQINRALANTAPIQGLPVYGAQALGQLDRRLVDFIVKNLVSKEGDKAKFKAFATIYDSKFTLKKDVTAYLIAKMVANLGLVVPPPWGYISAAIAYGIHIYANVQLVDIGIEWVILEGLEVLVTSPVVKSIKVDVLEKQLIPALAAHGDFIAGRRASSNSSSQNAAQAGEGIVNAAIVDSLNHLGEVYNVEAAIFPGARNFRLPIVGEPAPSLQPTQQDEPEWGTDAIVATDPGDVLGDLEEQVEDSKDSIRDRIEALQEGLELLAELEANIDEQLAKGDELSAEERQAFQAEKQEIARSRAEKQERVRKLQAELAELEKKQREIRQIMQSLAQVPPGSGNISALPAHVARDKMNQAEERYTQWVRATYPYVDSFRAPIVSQFETLLGKSKAAEHFVKWTNRYTLTKAWQFRSGFRFEKVSDNRGQWKKDANAKQLVMYVMEGAFASSGPRRDRKGHELWTQATDAGKQDAERRFTVIGLTHREIEPLFSPVIYPVANRDGITTFAQAIFYNGNEQSPAAIGAKSKSQAKLGWDTLNWDPATNTPEWGGGPHRSSAKWPWELFDSSTSFTATAKVKLNWQAKLMPVTKSRFQSAMQGSLVNPEMAPNVIKARLFFDSMVSH